MWNVFRWNKKLNYAFGISKDGVRDVTKRYTRKWHDVPGLRSHSLSMSLITCFNEIFLDHLPLLQVLSRRNMITESSLDIVLAKLTSECRRTLPPHVVSVLEDRDKKEMEEIERDLHSTDDASVSLPGRRSGNKEWRISRAETSPDDNHSLSCSTCPVRTCVDEHVTRIYNSFSPVLSLLADKSAPQPKVVTVFEPLKGLLEKLRSSSFRNRRVSLDSVLRDDPNLVHQLLPALSEMLDVLSLKCEEKDGKFDLCLAGDPVKTSLTLPVVLDALEDTIAYLKENKNFIEQIHSLPLVKMGRIHSGSVLASGEEIPLGVVS